MVAWIASGLSILGIILNAKKKILCWPVWLLSCFTWLYVALFNYDNPHWPEVVLWGTFALFNSYGWYEWSRK